MHHKTLALMHASSTTTPMHIQITTQLEEQTGVCEGLLSCEELYHLWPSLLPAEATVGGSSPTVLASTPCHRPEGLACVHQCPCAHSNLLGWSLPPRGAPEYPRPACRPSTSQNFALQWSRSAKRDISGHIQRANAMSLRRGLWHCALLTTSLDTRREQAQMPSTVRRILDHLFGAPDSPKRKCFLGPTRT